MALYGIIWHYMNMALYGIIWIWHYTALNKYGIIWHCMNMALYEYGTIWHYMNMALNSIYDRSKSRSGIGHLSKSVCSDHRHGGRIQLWQNPVAISTWQTCGDFCRLLIFLFWRKKVSKGGFWPSFFWIKCQPRATCIVWNRFDATFSVPLVTFPICRSHPKACWHCIFRFFDVPSLSVVSLVLTMTTKLD